ncbi:11241_t:CDS:2, partial [Gigaspora margarita]
MLDSITKLKSKSTQQQNMPLKQIVNTSQSSNYKLYESNLSKFMQEHVLEYIDVTGDAMKLKPNVPVPPITNGWEEICKNLFLERIAHFKKEYGEERKQLQKENLEYDSII